MKRLIPVLVVWILCACKDKTANNNSPDINKSDSGPAPSTNTDAGIYSVQLADTTISLQQWDSTINLREQLGQPIQQKNSKLDSSADTYAGSFTKEMEFAGLRLKLFSPPQNGKSFWIQEMVITTSEYKTANGITIGDELEKVKRAYPSLEKFPGRNADMYYIKDSMYEKIMEMEFENNRLKTLRIYYDLP
jgi:hypothetical protein